MPVAVNHAPVEVMEGSKGTLLASLVLVVLASVLCCAGSAGLYVLARVLLIALERFEKLM